MNNIKQSIRQKPLTAISSHFTPGINETKGITVVIFIIKATHNAMIPNPYIMRYGLKNSFIVGASIPEHFFTVYLTHFSKPANSTVNEATLFGCRSYTFLKMQQLTKVSTLEVVQFVRGTCTR